MMHLSAARFLLPVPPMFPILVDGAARSGRRTPEPHVWPAAPPSMRGDCWRGAAMDVSDFIRRRREELREEAANVGLSPTDALLYWGEDSLVFEIVSAEMGVSEDPDMAMGFRACLMERLLNCLQDGSLTALCMTNDGLTQVNVPAERWFDYHVAASSGEHQELVGRHHSEARDRRWGSIGGLLIWTCPNRLTEGAFPAYSPFPEFSDMDGVVIRDPTGDLSPSEFDSPAQASDAIHPGLVAGHHSQVDDAVPSSRQIDDGRYCAEMAVSAPVLCLSEEAVIEELLGYADIGDMTKSVIGKMARGMRRSLSQNRFDVEFWRAFRAKAKERGIPLRRRGRPSIK